jgi:hypothetical protein
VGEIETTVHFGLHILNLSAVHRASLQFVAFYVEADQIDSGQFMVAGGTGGIDVGTIKTNLAPEEDTEGIVRVSIPTSIFRAHRGPRRMRVRIMERISGKQVDIKLN